jgi:hyperosmotically inducible protein
MQKLVLFTLLFAMAAVAVAQTSQTVQSGSAAQTDISSEPVISSNGPVVAGFGNKLPANGHPTEMKIAKEVRHELLMLPYYSLFDDLEYSVQGRAVTLIGSVTSDHSQTKQDAERAVKSIEGVESVNNIQVLPPAQFDQQIREQVYRRLNNAGGLSQYFWQAAPSIHIIVANSNVTLKGYVDSTGDKDLAGITVKEVPDVFNVKNELQVVK